MYNKARRIVMTRRALLHIFLEGSWKGVKGEPFFQEGLPLAFSAFSALYQNAQLPSTKMATRSPLSVMAVTDRSSVPIMKSTWIMDSLMPMA